MTDESFYVEELDQASVVAVARRGARVEMGAEARERVRASRGRVEAMIEGSLPVYGVTTGFGALANTRIAADQRLELQRSLLRSHAAGMGPFLQPEVVRAMMTIRARTLAAGYSGVRPELVDALMDFLNAGLIPAVPEHGSMGASGDLAPLAHIGLCLIGEGLMLEEGEPVQARKALEKAGLQPFQLATKEGLALINGTDGMLAMLLLALEDLQILLKTADVTAAMSVEALFGTDRVFREDLHLLRPHPGQLASARNIARVLSGSPIVASHRDSPHLVQDAYSLRCAPQVYGAARDTLEHARRVAARELDSVTDNPVVLPDGRVESAGQLPRGAARVRPRLPRHRRFGDRSHHRAQDRPHAGPRALRGPARLPQPATRRQLGVHDPTLHGGCPGGREPPPREPCEHGFPPHLRHAGRP